MANKSVDDLTAASAFDGTERFYVRQGANGRKGLLSQLSTWLQSTFALKGTSSLIGRQVITATGAGTYTPTAGTTSIVIELFGAGGGGGGVPSPTGSNVALSRGGCAGGYLLKRLTANFSGASYSVGAKGAGGAAGSNNGVAGGNTTFTDTAGSPTTYTAAGGGAGGMGAAGAAPRVSTGFVAAGGTATNGDLNVQGASSGAGLAVSSSIVFGSHGANGFRGAGGIHGTVGLANSSTEGGDASGYGAGGGGAVATGTGAAAAGGDGSDGLIIISEYA